MKKVLIVDDQRAQLRSLQLLLKYSPLKGKIAVETAQTVDAASTILKRGDIELVLCDVNIDQDYGPDLRKRFPRIMFIYMTGDSNWKAPDKSPVLYKPHPPEKLYDQIERMLDLAEGIEENLFRLARLIANQEVTVEDAVKNLLEVAPPGWSGTTKKMKEKMGDKKAFALSWWMHKRGARPNYKPEPGKPKYRSPAKISK